MPDVAFPVSGAIAARIATERIAAAGFTVHLADVPGLFDVGPHRDLTCWQLVDLAQLLAPSSLVISV